MMKVLLPVDGMDDAKLIMDFVSKYHWSQQTQFKVLHVIGATNTEDELIAAEEAAGKLLKEICRQVELVLPESEVTSEVRSGSAVYEIVMEAFHWPANMIVMGYRTRDAAKPFLAGSVSSGVSTQASCSVAIIRPEVVKETASGSNESGSQVHDWLASSHV